jgi:hypothetical protein
VSEDAIEFPAEIIKVQTMVDGAIRVTLDLPADQIGTASKIMQAKLGGAYLQIAAVPIVERVKENGRKQRKADTSTDDSDATY